MEASLRDGAGSARLHPEDLEFLARRVADLVRGEPERGYVDTASVARMLSVGRDWVRAHATELGAVRLGDGPRGALRFDSERVRDLLDARRIGEGTLTPAKPRGRPRRSEVQLLPLPGDPR
jgi:hypothetical protein